VDGNNVLEVHNAVKEIAQEIRLNPKPYILECLTFRMRGHEEASGTKYVHKNCLTTWEEKDPIVNYEKYLLSRGFINDTFIDEIKQSIKADIEWGLEQVFAEPDILANPENEAKRRVSTLFHLKQQN